MAPRLTRSSASHPALTGGASASSSSHPPSVASTSSGTSKTSKKAAGRTKKAPAAAPVRVAPTPPRVVPAVDRLSPLSSELISLILHHLSPPSSPDSVSLASLALVSKSLLPHIRLHLYRSLKVDTRTNAHSMHRTLHGNSDINKNVKAITADVGTMSRTSSQWLGASFPPFHLASLTCVLTRFEI